MRRHALALLLLTPAMFLAAHATVAAEAPLTVEQVIARNVTAVGGLDAWRKVQTLSWSGHIESANPATSGVPFVMQLKRPDKTRFQIKSQNQQSVRAFDGRVGWKMRQVRDAQPQQEEFTQEEMVFARDAFAIDGPLVDYKAKGVKVEMHGTDPVEGHAAYRLELTLPSGLMRRLWVDAKSFMIIRVDREISTPEGRTGRVSVYYRKYGKFEGLQIPVSIETVAGEQRSGDKMVIDKVVVNPPMPDALFTRPPMPAKRSTVPGATAGNNK